MNELDTGYTALAEALGRVGEANTPLFLATLALSLLAALPDTQSGLDAIAQAEGLVGDR
jgi:hypothetical protein